MTSLPTIETDTRYAESLDAFHRASRVIAGGVNSNFRAGGEPCPLTFSRAFGSHLVDIDGNDYVDYALGMGPNILGHAHPAVIDAVDAALRQGQLFAGQHRGETELAELVVALVPGAELVRFGQSGTEMDQLALRLARAYTGRARFVRFDGHYHGWLDPLYAGADGAHPSADQIILDWNDVDQLAQAFERAGGDIAAVIMEPVLCNTGVISPRPGYLQGVRDLCDRWGAVLIFDEVITGFRICLGGAQELFGVKPDLAVFAKAMGSGFPIAALVGRRDILSLLAEGHVMHGGTYNTGTSAVAAGCATLRTLRDHNPYPSLLRAGQSLMQAIGAMAERRGIELAVEGPGSVFHTRFGPSGGVHDAKTFAERSDVVLRRQFVTALQDEGVRITSRGTWFLSTAHSDEDLDRTVEAVDRVLERLAVEPAEL